MLLNDLPMKELLVLHNQLAEKPLSLKSFATKVKLINRINQLTTDKHLNIDSLTDYKLDSEPKQANQPLDKVFESHRPYKHQKGKGIGKLAKQLLLEGQSYSYKTIVEMISQQIPKANTSTNAICWYACQLRKEGLEIPKKEKGK